MFLLFVSPLTKVLALLEQKGFQERYKKKKKREKEKNYKLNF